MSKWSDVPPTLITMYGEKLVDARVQPPWTIPEELIIRAAICGAFFDKEQNPNQPISLDEIKAAALDAARSGACSVHFHVRDERRVRYQKLGLLPPRDYPYTKPSG